MKGRASATVAATKIATGIVNLNVKAVGAAVAAEPPLVNGMMKRGRRLHRRRREASLACRRAREIGTRLADANPDPGSNSSRGGLMGPSRSPSGERA